MWETHLQTKGKTEPLRTGKKMEVQKTRYLPCFLVDESPSITVPGSGLQSHNVGPLPDSPSHTNRKPRHMQICLAHSSFSKARCPELDPQVRALHGPV